MDKEHHFSILRIGFAITLFLAILLCILLIRSPFFLKAKAQDSSRVIQKVTTQIVQYQNSYLYQRYFIGQVEALQSSALGFEISGMLDGILFDEGDNVSVKAVLATLDTARLSAGKKEAIANVALAKSNAKLAAATYKRVSSVHRANAVTTQERDEAREARDASKSAQAVAKAQLESILVDINKTKLLSPFDGIVVKRMADLGTVVTAGQPILEIQQKANFKVRVGVTREIADKLTLGEQHALKINGETYQGRIKAILPVRGQARTIDLIFGLTESNKLRSGDIARLPIEYQIEKRGFWVPLSALVEGKRGLWSLYVVDSKTNKIERRTVSVHYSRNDGAFVFGAVDEGETIVAKGAAKLVPNLQIQRVASDE